MPITALKAPQMSPIGTPQRQGIRWLSLLPVMLIPPASACTVTS
jgi:hypothetical protein